MTNETEYKPTPQLTLKEASELFGISNNDLTPKENIRHLIESLDSVGARIEVLCTIIKFLRPYTANRLLDAHADLIPLDDQEEIMTEYQQDNPLLPQS